MIKSCSRCLKDFNTVNGATRYCVFCRPKAIDELKYQRGLKRSAKKREKKTGVYELRGWKHRIGIANEKRAEFISQWYVDNGVLLNF